MNRGIPIQFIRVSRADPPDFASSDGEDIAEGFRPTPQPITFGEWNRRLVREMKLRLDSVWSWPSFLKAFSATIWYLAE